MINKNKITITTSETSEYVIEKWFCKQCGIQIQSDSDKFCRGCGISLE